jgi:hypothetical protein
LGLGSVRIGGLGNILDRSRNRKLHEQRRRAGWGWWSSTNGGRAVPGVRSALTDGVGRGGSD